MKSWKKMQESLWKMGSQRSDRKMEEKEKQKEATKAYFKKFEQRELEREDKETKRFFYGL